MTMTTRVRCSWCRNFVALTTKGKLYRHYTTEPPGKACIGSGSWPTKLEWENES